MNLSMEGWDCRGVKARGTLIDSSVVVVDESEARALYACGFYGQPLEVEKPRGADFRGPLRLSLIEALYLSEKGVVDIVDADGKHVPPSRLKEEATQLFPDIDILYKIYRDLRERGLIVRSGLKFGADFAVYRLGPGLEHAPFIVHVYHYNHTLDPVELVRAGRLSHSVRKRFVLATVEPSGEASYLVIGWFRP